MCVTLIKRAYHDIIRHRAARHPWSVYGAVDWNHLARVTYTAWFTFTHSGRFLKFFKGPQGAQPIRACIACMTFFLSFFVLVFKVSKS